VQVTLDQYQGRSMLSDEQRAALGAPITTPLPPSVPPGTPGYVPPPNYPSHNGTPGFDGSAPPVPGGTALPVAPPLSQEDLIIEQRNSQFLGDNLRAAGSNPPSEGSEAHHIVPSNAGDARMDALRAQLAAWDIDLNSAANGVWLPGPNAPEDASGAYHRRLNNEVYDRAVISKLNEATTRDDAIRILNDIANQLANGDFPGVRPRPGRGNDR
jgi:A nuclease family of the HNH/ENDO VII superfamily with conserved AHH